MNDRDKYKIQRIMKKITLKEISEHIGCSLDLLSKYENGKRNMNDQYILKYKQYIENY